MKWHDLQLIAFSVCNLCGCSFPTALFTPHGSDLMGPAHGETHLAITFSFSCRTSLDLELLPSWSLHVFLRTWMLEVLNGWVY